MQPTSNQEKTFNKITGELFNELRKKKSNVSMSKFAREYEFDRGNFSKIERGIVGCRLITAWKFCEASGIKFSEFAKILEDKLGKDFKLIDE